MILLALIVAIAGVLLVLVHASYRREIGRARERVATGSEVVQTRCGPVEYAVLGRGPPILIVHGAGGGYDQGIEIGGPLARIGFRVVAMSRFGYLRTPRPEQAPALALADTLAARFGAQRIERAATLRASAGPPSAMEFALRHRER